MSGPYFQRIVVTRKVYVLFLLSHINKTQRGKHIKIIFRHCCKISVEDTIFYKLTGQIKPNLSLKNRRKKKNWLCTEAKYKFTNFSQIPHHVEWRYPYISPWSNHWQTISNLRGIHHSESLANLLSLETCQYH